MSIENDKKMKRPAFQFYPSDWRSDAALQSCSIAARGLWHELMCIMHECRPYGCLAINCKSIDNAQAARLVGVSLPEYRKLLHELEDAGVFSRQEDGTIYSRRMVKDERIRNIRADAGRLGGNPHLLNQKDNLPPNQSDKQKPTPSSSSSTSTSVRSDANASQGGRKKSSFVPPTLDEVRAYFAEKGYRQDAADKAFAYYQEGGWKDSKGNQVKNWKQKMQGVWFRDENKAAGGALAATADKAQWAWMQPVPFGDPERWTLEEYNRLKDRTEYRFIRYE